MLSMFSKTAGKTEVAAAVAVAPLPAGQIERDGRITSASPDLVGLACDGWTIKQKIDALQKELKAITEKLENSLGAGAALVVDNVCRVTLSSRQIFKLMDVGRAESLLGGRFADLVETNTEYTLTDKLKNIVLDPDHPLSDGLRGCILVKESMTVSFRPGKAL